MGASARNGQEAGRQHTACVIAAFGRQCLVRFDGEGTTRQAVRRGKRGDLVVGDRVTCLADGPTIVVESILPRRALLFRADGLRTKEMAANLDLMVVVYAPQPRFNLWFVWRALVAAAAAGIAQLVVLNKADLPTASDTDGAADVLRQLQALGYATLQLSAKHDSQAAERALRAYIGNRVALLIGQSGMGKSTLLNLLVPDAMARTQEYSTALNLGRQTTTAARWFDLPASEGGAVIDTPGFQEFGVAHLSIADLASALPEFAAALGHCRFADCRHLDEPGCAVHALRAAGNISAARYAFYRALAQATLAPSPAR